MKNLFVRIQLASLGLAALLTLPGAARAVDFHVTTAQELQNALTLAAANGADDNLYLTNGYYVGNFNYNSAEAGSLTLWGEPGTTNTDITIDGAGGGRSMSLTSSANAAMTVRGLTFLRNCGATENASLRVATGKGADVIVEYCRFISPTNSRGIGLELVSGRNAAVNGCRAQGTGGYNDGIGISISGITGNVSVQNCTVASNSKSLFWQTGYYGAGLLVSTGSVITVVGNRFIGNRGGGAACLGTTVTLADNTFTSNTGGSGAYSSGTTVVLTNNTFTGNTATGDYNGGGSGGGAYCSGTTVKLTRNTFNGNQVSSSSSAAGGGAYCSGTVTVSYNTFTGNSTEGTGGGAFCSGTVVLTGNTFAGNSASTGAGIHCQSGGGLVGSRSATLTGNTFTSNSASGSGGGASYSSDETGTLTLSGNSFKSNRAASGGGLYADGGAYSNGGKVRLLNNLFVANSQSSSSSKGGGVWVRAIALDMINNTVTANTAAGSGGGAAFDVVGVSEVLHVYNNILWGNTASGNGGDVHLIGTGSRKEFLFNDAHAMYGVWDIAVNNLDVAPLFFDPVNGDYHPRNTSACVNAGTNGAPYLPATDLDGGPRIADNTVDLGCYEFSNTSGHPADVNGDWVIIEAEYTAYAAAWKNDQSWNPGPNPIPADYVTRAGYLKSQSGGSYHNDGSTRPVCWKPGL